MHELDAPQGNHHGSCGGLPIKFVFIRSGVAARVTVWGGGYLGWVVALRDVFSRGVTSCSARHYHRVGSKTALFVSVRAAADMMMPLHRKSQMIKIVE